MISVGLRTDRQTPELERLAARTRNRRGFMAAVGKAGEVALRAHFARREDAPNAKGWPKTHFWNRRIRANTVLTEVTDSLAVIDIAAPEFRQKLYGGTITPKGGRKFLAIPARSEAYGKSPLSFGNLRFVPTGAGKGMLVADQAIQGPLQRGVKRAKGNGIAYYFLVKSVHQNPDPNALPEPSAFAHRLFLAGNDYLLTEATRA